jgi:hypothetical protein
MANHQDGKMPLPLFAEDQFQARVYHFSQATYTHSLCPGKFGKSWMDQAEFMQHSVAIVETFVH